MKTVLFASALLLATPALAQNAVVVEPQATGTLGAVQPGGPDIANSGPASTGEFAPGGSAAARASNNSAGDSNAEQTNRVLPNLGRGGGGNGTGGGG